MGASPVKLDNDCNVLQNYIHDNLFIYYNTSVVLRIIVLKLIYLSIGFHIGSSNMSHILDALPQHFPLISLACFPSETFHSQLSHSPFGMISSLYSSHRASFPSSHVGHFLCSFSLYMFSSKWLLIVKR